MEMLKIRQKTSRETVSLESEGAQLSGMFHAPVMESHHSIPAVLVCHGFAGSKVGQCRMYVRMAEALAEQGIATLRLDCRGCGDSEGRFRDTTFEGQVVDGLAGLSYLRRRKGIDPQRIGLLGRSMGGPIAVRVAAEAGDIKSMAFWSAVFSGDPWQDKWQEALLTAKERGRPLEVLPVEGNLANPKFFEQFFTFDMEKELCKLSALPLFCIHSEKDEIVDVQHYHAFQRCRQDLCATTRFLQLARGNHNFSDPEEQEITLDRTVAWWRETLSGGLLG